MQLLLAVYTGVHAQALGRFYKCEKFIIDKTLWHIKMEAIIDGIKEEPDSSENTDYPDPDCVNENSLSPAASDENRSAGSGGEEKINRRKRKAPMKLQIEPEEQHSSPQVPMIEQVFSMKKEQIHNGVKQCAVMTEERARNQAINSLPRSTCPVCGDKANGLHYGIYTCEA